MRKKKGHLNSYDAVVASCRPKDSYAWLFVGKTRLAVRKWPGIQQGEPASVAIRPEDVLLSEGYPGRISARNVLPGRVKSLKHFPDGIRVSVDVGFALTSLVTEETVDDLRLRPGSAVYAIVKATAILPLATIRASYRVSLIGSRGVLDPQAIDFLRAVAAMGSLSEAATALGISFRTAWMRARSINRSWDRPLLVRASGGKGGGGSALTPEGMAAVARADELESRTA